jgi:hypothetical protein
MGEFEILSASRSGSMAKVSVLVLVVCVRMELTFIST